MLIKALPAFWRHHFSNKAHIGIFSTGCGCVLCHFYSFCFSSSWFFLSSHYADPSQCESWRLTACMGEGCVRASFSKPPLLYSFSRCVRCVCPLSGKWAGSSMFPKAPAFPSTTPSWPPAPSTASSIQATGPSTRSVSRKVTRNPKSTHFALLLRQK